MIVEATGAGMAFVRDPMGIRYEVMSWKGKGLVEEWLRGRPDEARFARAARGK